MPRTLLSRLSLVTLFVFSITASGCSYIPWIGDDESEEDLAFEQEFGDETESGSEFEEASASEDEDSFFADEGPSEGGFEDAPTPESDGFSSVNQVAEGGELRTDVETLQAQQEVLITRVRELQEIIQTMDSRLAAAQSQLETAGVGGAGAISPTVEPDVERLKTEVSQLNQEISRLKAKEGQMRTAAVSRSSTRSSSRRGSSKLPAAYTKALNADRAGDYDGAILQFREFSDKNPPSHLKDNIVFWIGNNYFKLDMYEDAIAQFQSVIENHPRGNKVHDSRYMLGLSFYKKGDRGRALDILEAALKTNPPSEVRDKIQKQLMEIK